MGRNHANKENFFIFSKLIKLNQRNSVVIKRQHAGLGGGLAPANVLEVYLLSECHQTATFCAQQRQ